MLSIYTKLGGNLDGDDEPTPMDIGQVVQHNEPARYPLLCPLYAREVCQKTSDPQLRLQNHC